jgi:two-component system, NtrC family, sensor histidine kinase HydH
MVWHGRRCEPCGATLALPTCHGTCIGCDLASTQPSLFMPSIFPTANLARFNLSRWFAVTALVSITVLSVVLGLLLNRFVTQRLQWQEAVLTKEFVQSMVQMDKPLQAYLDQPARGLNPDIEAAFQDIAAMPDMFRANVYGPGRRMIWSSDRSLIGRVFGPNHELDAALAGHVVTKTAHPKLSKPDKDEHQDLKHPDTFVEIYVPVLDASGSRVLAIVEFYKNPRTLLAALNSLRLYIILGATTSGLLLFLALYGLVRRADLTIRHQQRQLVDNETLAVIGEMSAAVAHGIRNPLASIRSSAELIQDGDLAQAQEAAADIVGQSDRLEVWVRELLAYTRPIDEVAAPVPLQPLVERCLEAFARDFERRHIRSHNALTADLPAVRGDALLLGQVISSLVANAIEAMESNGDIIVKSDWTHGQSKLTLSVQDTGPGMSPDQVQRVGKPFQTTKARGLGVGLALARRVMERFGGGLEIDSAPGSGTTVRLHMNVA